MAHLLCFDNYIQRLHPMGSYQYGKPLERDVSARIVQIVMPTCCRWSIPRRKLGQKLLARDLHVLQRLLLFQPFSAVIISSVPGLV